MGTHQHPAHPRFLRHCFTGAFVLQFKEVYYSVLLSVCARLLVRYSELSGVRYSGVRFVLVSAPIMPPDTSLDTILDREYNMVGGAEVIKLHQLIFEFGTIA